MSTAAAPHATPKKRKASSSDEIDFTKNLLQFSFAKGACKCKGCHDEIEQGEPRLSLFEYKEDAKTAISGDHFHCKADCCIREVIKPDSSTEKKMLKSVVFVKILLMMKTVRNYSFLLVEPPSIVQRLKPLLRVRFAAPSASKLYACMLKV